MSNFYENQTLSIERAVLAEDIILPDITELKDTLAKFFLPIMTPMLKTDVVTESVKIIPPLKGSNQSSNSCTSTNYISLYIPKYILMNFDKKVPKGTEFIITSIDGSIKIDDMRIIGIYTLPTPSPS